MRNELFAGIEAGGTKFICGIGNGPGDLVTTRIATTTPEATVAAATDWIRSRASERLSAVGIASFGPVDLDPASPTWGHITTTPKPGWRNFDFAGEVQRALGVPVAFETDVNAAVLAEAEWGAAREVPNALYLTIGTGIGGGALLRGRFLHGQAHPEMGHIRIPRDPADQFSGACPWHTDCLEGLASGPAISARWGTSAHDLPNDHAAWPLEARYLAQALANFACTFAPHRIILGGGVMRRTLLYDLIRVELPRVLAGYVAAPDIGPPGLGDNSGILGALLLAKMNKTR
jgi:fructokinase